MRDELTLTLCALLLFGACGGESTHRGDIVRDAGTEPDAGGTCAEPPLIVPDLPPFELPPRHDQTYQVTFRNDCAETVWPAWCSGGGLDNTTIENQLWLPLPSGAERTVTAYGFVREIAFWGRTGCRFDQHGVGACATGDCGSLVCSGYGYQIPESATGFNLFGGFFAGYNLPMSVTGAACGSHDCAADLDTCSEASVVLNACGETIACTDTCSGSSPSCCRDQTRGCDDLSYPNDGEGSLDLVIAFCP